MSAVALDSEFLLKVKEHPRNNAELLLGLSTALHADPELAFSEHRAAARIGAVLSEAGFDTRVGVYGLETAIEARFGSGSLRVGVCAEYDALPGLGHACGHNIIASSAVGAALALASVADELDLTVVLLGTPAEEDGGGKVLMLDAGAFDGLDFAMMVHPCPQMDVNVSGTTSQGVDRFIASFAGLASHAAAAPSFGVNAGNALTLAQVAVGLLRQQLADGIRINAVVREGGSAINVIPASGTLEVEVRSSDLEQQEDAKAKVLRACEGAALAAGCTFTWEQVNVPYLPLKHDERVLEHFNQAITATGRRLVTLPPGGSAGGSTDMGNVSRRIPAIHPVIGVLDTTGMPHTAAFAESTDGPGAKDAVLDAAAGLAGAGVRVALDRELRAALGAERSARSAAGRVGE